MFWVLLPLMLTEERASTGTMPTDRGYTGQLEADEVGLYYYNARWYDAELARFAEADSIVPDPGSAVAYETYTYALNNPIRYNDPGGHYYCDLLNNNNLEDCTSGQQRTASVTRKNIPSWDQTFIKNVRMQDISRAEAAYIHLISNPSQLVESYVNPQNASLEYDALELFAQYSTLQTTAENLILNTVAFGYGIDAAEDLMDAQMHNLEAYLSGETENLLHADRIISSGTIASVVITFGHGYRHLVGLDVTQSEVEAAIRESVQLSVNSASETGWFWGRVTVRGELIEYRAMTRRNGIILEDF